MLISPAFLVDQKNVVYVRCSVHRIIISKVQLPLLLPFPDRDRASSVSTVETKPNHSWLKDSTSAKCSFHCSILSHHLAPFILSPGLFSQLHRPLRFHVSASRYAWGRASLFPSTDHINEKYML